MDIMDNNIITGESAINEFLKNETVVGKQYKVKFWSGEGILQRTGTHKITKYPLFRKVKNGQMIGPEMNWDGGTITKVERN